MRILEFRTEVLMWSVNNVLWGLLFVAVIDVLFSQVTSIAGWGKIDVLLVMVMQELFLAILWWWVIPSFLTLSTTIRTDNLDGYLLKPVPS